MQKLVEQISSDDTQQVQAVMLSNVSVVWHNACGLIDGAFDTICQSRR